ncbi:MAG: sigma-54 dependent transcriptional regulator [Phycisphaerales bacterium]|nr:sigma-54 dependent transcriptional regulator [Phycisphaerales bacterium]
MANILIIEDDETLRFTIARALEKASHSVVAKETLDEARASFNAESFDLVLSDVHLGQESGIEFVDEIRTNGYTGGIIVMTAYATVDDAVSAMKLGADDYLPKPVRLDELTLLTGRLLDQCKQSKQLRLYQRIHKSRTESKRPLGQSEAWVSSVHFAERLAQIPVVNRTEDLGTTSGGAVTTILITGETGVGKGVIARHIHESGPDPTQPFVHVNCTALPSTLIEGELFGHAKGAFTDAKEAREGLFEMADGGTIFLDEIGDLPLELQAKLLTVLEQGKIRRVGSTKERAIRVRVLAATNRDLERKVREGTFREDLLFRINAFVVNLPALRDRGADSVLIAESMLQRLRKEYGLDQINLNIEATEAIQRYSWPGNVRELFNIIQRSAMLCDHHEIMISDLGLPFDSEQYSPESENQNISSNEIRFDFVDGIHTADEIEKLLMLQALEYTRGNVSKAARLIGMQRSSFRYRIERYGIEARIAKIAQR